MMGTDIIEFSMADFLYVELWWDNAVPFLLFLYSSSFFVGCFQLEISKKSEVSSG